MMKKKENTSDSLVNTLATATWKEAEYSNAAVCQRCKGMPAINVFIGGVYPAILCAPCRSDLEYRSRGNIIWRGLIATRQKLMLADPYSTEYAGLFSLKLDFERDFYNDFVKDWLGEGNGDG